MRTRAHGSGRNSASARCDRRAFLLQPRAGAQPLALSRRVGAVFREKGKEAMMRELQRAEVSERIDAEWRGLYVRGLHAGALAAASWLSARCLCATAGGWEV